MNSNVYVISGKRLYKPGEAKVRFRNFNYSKAAKWYDICNIHIKETVSGKDVWTPSYSYQWDMSEEWDNVCDEDCGGGLIHRKPGTCTRTNLTTKAKDTVDEFICAFLYRKDPDYDYTQPCNTNVSCSADKYKWVVDEWGECLGGYRGRNVGCFVEYTSKAGQPIYHMVDDSFCSKLGAKPPQTEVC